MSGGSQHNPNGRQSQLGPGWSPLQVANFLARAPQAHMASERGVTWHTPTPPPHLYHVPAPSPPDPLQAIKGASANSVFRHTATPPELYRHTPTPPDKHLLRHTPSPGDVKANATLPSAELFPHLGPSREKIARAEELLAYARGGVDLTVGGPRGANGSPSPAPAPASAPASAPAPALSVRDAPTINSLIARAAPHARGPLARVDALLERLTPAPGAMAAAAPTPPPASPHSVIVHPRTQHTPSPPSSNEDSTDSCGVPPGSKRKRKPERTIRMPVVLPPKPEPRRTPTPTHTNTPTPTPTPTPIPEPIEPLLTAKTSPRDDKPITAPLENGDAHSHTNGPPSERPPTPPQPERPHTRRKTRSGSAETIDDIAAMIASTTDSRAAEPTPVVPETPVSVDKLKSVLASPEPELKAEPEKEEAPVVEAAAAPRRRSARTSNTEATNVPVESPSEAKAAEAEEAGSAQPTAASFVEVENQLEKMFAGLEEEPAPPHRLAHTPKPKKRRKSAPTKGDRKVAKRVARASIDEARRKTPRRKAEGAKKPKENTVKDAYDSGSNASSGRSRGPYIQIVGPCASPVSVSVVNAAAEEASGGGGGGGGGGEWRNGLRARGLHASTLGLRYDASTPDASWLCAFCERGPHANALGDLFGPYTVATDCDEYRALDEASRRRFPCAAGGGGGAEVWVHEACAVWAGGVVAAGARVWGLAAAVWGARAARCGLCGAAGAALACAARACRARVHVPCAPAADWHLPEDDFRALCPRHAPPRPAPAAPPNR